MSGTIVEYENRAFWSKHIVDVWLYHLGYIITQEEDMPANAIQWAKKYMEWAKQGTPDFMFTKVHLEFITDCGLELLLQLSQKLMKQLNNYDGFLKEEKQRLGITDDYNFELSHVVRSDNSHEEMVGSITLSSISKLKTFGYLFIKMLTGENWHRAYFNSYADPRLVATVDYLEAIKPDGEVGSSSIREGERWKGSGPFWVSPNNPNASIEWLPHSNGQHICKGIPDLFVIGGHVNDWEEDWPEEFKIDYDALELQEAQQDRFREKWILDRERCITLLISTEGQGSAVRYSADEDFYSPALGKTVNLKSLFDI